MENPRDRLVIRKDSYMTFDEKTGNYTLTNKSVFHDVIIISIPSFLKLERELFNIFGSGAADILKLSGEAAGGESAKRITHVENLEDDVRTIFNSVSKWGFGKYELVDLDLDAGHVKFKLHNNPLVIHNEKSGSGSMDQAVTNNHHFLIGFYGGYFHMIFDGQVVCKETKCMNTGDAFCEFEVKKLP